ncbi:MAG TPA: phosphoribosylaminoimidazolesuccinocarboxamide synthase [Bacteroidia bacterium]|jgi:phosphoribosylaminoimidazole-succinocarboxamide synthase|nr:phosphoribosylaminoimidazolesuccinocarboxamide synthase [Bacteroidia bacterium]
MKTITATNYKFPGQKSFYKGKVRDVYNINDEMLVMIVSDRVSAFDVVLPRGVPYKGQVLNQTAAHFMKATTDIVPNWIDATPHPMVSIGKMCQPFKVEMVIRGYLSGHAAREYSAGKRQICGVGMPEGMHENDAFRAPIVTPTTKADVGHDEDISKDEILKKGLVSKEHYEQLEHYTQMLFKRGTEMAAKQGLILVDTKYEFGLYDGKIYLIDEIHTPDSSRYFYKDGYEERQKNKEPQKQLSKEFLRQWLIENGFQGKPGQKMPVITDEIVEAVSKRYIELYEQITGLKFVASSEMTDPEKSIEESVLKYIGQHSMA